MTVTIPALPEGYTWALAKKRNLLLGYHATEPILYLDEDSMEWRVLDHHVSEVHPAQDPSKSAGPQPLT